MAEEGNDAVPEQVEEDFSVWKKNTPFLYDLVISHPLEWPSLTVHWSPSPPQAHSDPSFAVHKLLLGTYTSDDAPNFLMIADAVLPSGSLSDPVDADAENPTIPKVGNSKF